MDDKVCVFSVKIIAEVFGRDGILVDKIKFADMVEAQNRTAAFKKIRKILQQKASRRGYRRKNGYRFQYCTPGATFKKIWEKTISLSLN